MEISEKFEYVLETLEKYDLLFKRSDFHELNPDSLSERESVSLSLLQVGLGAHEVQADYNLLKIEKEEITKIEFLEGTEEWMNNMSIDEIKQVIERLKKCQEYIIDIIDEELE
tara:strand:- start:104 stop:442 length:339 start_codon:yes stop_codon:yes gene_type:complete